MDEVSLDTLVLNGECDVQWGTRGVTTVHRTFEIHTNNILYCFNEPKDSMAKHVKEKVYLEGCRVVDGGAYSGASERLLLFLVSYDYAEKVDLLGNRRAYIFAAEGDHDKSSKKNGSDLDALPSANYVVQFFLTDKMLKWRLLQAIQQASGEYAQFSPDSPLAGNLAGSGSGKSSSHGADAKRGSFARYNVPNRFETKVLGHAEPPTHARQSSDISVLSDHEVLQLSDVLREYDAMQQRKAAAKEGASVPAGTTNPASPLAPPVGHEDVRRTASTDDELLAETTTTATSEEACVSENAVDDEAGASGTASPNSAAPSISSAGVPARLQHSPLYESCICANCANQSCADCGAAFPSWCLLQPFGAFVCIECIGVHRKLWSNKCRGAELDLWPAADIAFMQTRGNAVVNGELEYYVAFPADSVEAAMHVDPPVKPVSIYSSIDVRESYIQWKYEEQLFTQRRHPSAAEPLPPRHDPAGLEQASRAAAITASAPGNTATAFGVNGSGAMAAYNGAASCDGDGRYTSPTQPHPLRSFMRDDGPPRYAGLLDVIVKELVGPESITGAVCVLTNGFQTLRTHASRQLLHMRTATVWDEHLQLGIEGAGRKPMYCTIYRGKGELLATGEVWLKEEVFQPGSSSMFAATLTWSQLHKKPNQRSPAERWKITFLTSYQMLL